MSSPTGTPERSMRPAVTSTSRAPGPSIGGRAAGRPRFLVTDDAGRTLALTRSWSVLPGGSAYVPRGPGPVATDGALLGSRLAAIGLALAEDHIDVVAADPEVPAADAAYRATIEAAGFHPIEEIQPSRHRVTLPLAGRTQDDGLRRDLEVDPSADPGGREAGHPRRSPRRPRRTRGPGRRVRGAQRAAGARTRPVLRPAARDGGATALLVRSAGGVRRLVDDGARGRPPRLPRGPGERRGARSPA